MKNSPDPWFAATNDPNSDYGTGFYQPIFFFRTVWRFICRLADSLEVFTLFPFAAMIVTVALFYRMATRGFYEIIFNSKRWPDEF